MSVSPYETLSSGICPWLQGPLRQLEAAHGAGRLGHGWLLAGPRGVGKINLALLAARRLLEDTHGDVRFLGADEAATAMTGRHEPMDHHPDLHWVFPEPKRNTLTVEQIREAAQALSLTSLTAQARVLVLEPADAMTTAAANALLKTLEEPGADTYLLLISHQPGRLPATIRSRCQSLSVRCPPVAEALTWLNGSGKDSETVDWIPLLEAARGVPFRAIDYHRSDFSNFYKELETTFYNVSTNRTDPQAVADAWLAGDIEAALSWLSARLQSIIRARLGPGRADDRDLTSSDLWNAWKPLPTRFLFEQQKNAELLLGQLGGGINVELAVRAILLGFRPKEGSGAPST